MRQAFCASAAWGRWRIVAGCLTLWTCGAAPAVAVEDTAAVQSGAKPKEAGRPAAATAAPEQRFEVDEFRVEGADNLPQIEVEQAVYPFLGPDRTEADIEKARAALQKAYHDKGFQTVTVSLPQQDAQRGFIVLKVVENRVGRLRVKGSRYFDLDKIRRTAPSLQEGKLPDLGANGAVNKDILALNQWPDRHVTPALRAGVTTGTVDVDLNVEDTNPLHGSLELNNRQSPSTAQLRENMTLQYNNLWQQGHSMSLSFQEAPENPSNAMVVSGSYLARTDYDWLNVMIYGLKSWSNVATVGDQNVIGPGQVFGGRAVITLPAQGELVHTLSLGVDYKDFKQSVAQIASQIAPIVGQNEAQSIAQSIEQLTGDSPVRYVPLVAAYSASWQGDGRLTQLNTTFTTGLRGIGSAPDQFDYRRYKATADFISLKADVSHTQDLAGGLQLFGKLQGQAANVPLVSSEQLSLGGQDTVRGYLESEVLGDYGIAGTLELRSPNLAPYLEQKLENPAGAPIKFNPFDEWRCFAFVDGGEARIFQPLPEQLEQFDLASYGIGSQLKSLKYLNGLIYVGMPLTSQQTTVAHHPRVSFRIWGEF